MIYNFLWIIIVIVIINSVDSLIEIWLNNFCRHSFYRFGKVLIIQDVDDIDPILLPILRNDYIIQG